LTTPEPHPYCIEHDQPLDWCSHAPNPTGIGDDGLTTDERAVYAEHWRSGVGRPLTTLEVEAVKAHAKLEELGGCG